MRITNLAGWGKSGPGTWGMVILALVVYGLCYAGLRAVVGWLYRSRGGKKP